MSPPAALSPESERMRPLYARVLRLRYLDPGATLCFVFFEGTVVLGLLLALAELVSWWAVLVLPATVAVMVKVNDVVAAAVARSASRVPATERERFRRELRPVIGRAAVPRPSIPGSSPGRAGWPPSDPAALRAPVAAAGESGRGGRPAPPLNMTAIVSSRFGFRSRFGSRLGPRVPGEPDAGGLGAAPASRHPARLHRVPPPVVAAAEVRVPPDPPVLMADRATCGPEPAATTMPADRPARTGPARWTNEQPAERAEQRTARCWPVRLDPVDSPRQRARQSARRRYQ